MREIFRKLATHISNIVGSPYAFVVAVLFVVSWLVTGSLFNYSDTWQLVINSVTNIVALLMIFILQYTQNRDSRAIHIKLDELLRGMHGARTGMVDIEDLSDEDLDALQAEFHELHEKYQQELKKRKKT